MMEKKSCLFLTSSWLNQGTFPGGAKSWFKEDSIKKLLPGHSPPTTPEGQDTSSENLLPADLITILHPMREIYCSQINAIFILMMTFFNEVRREQTHFKVKTKYCCEETKDICRLINSLTISLCNQLSNAVFTRSEVAWKLILRLALQTRKGH